MNPIRDLMTHEYDGPERRRSLRAALIAFWACVAISVIVSGGSLYVAYRSQKTSCVLQDFLSQTVRRGEQRLKDPRLPVTERIRSLEGVKESKELKAQLEGTGVFCG